MDFLRKGAQAAKKLGNQLLEVVDDHGAQAKDNAGSKDLPTHDTKADVFEERDHPKGGSSATGSSCSLEDAEFESAVKHFMTVNGNLKQLGMKAQIWNQSLKAQSADGHAVCTVSAEACRLEFEDEVSWIQSADKVKDISQLMEKYSTQLCALLQRDILDPITAELETNKDTKVLIENRRAGKSSGEDAADKLYEIMRRRKVLLAQCVTFLCSHQYNYYIRIAEQYQNLQPVVVDCRKRCADMATAAKARKENPNSSAPSPAKPAVSEQAAPAPSVRPAAPPPEEVKAAPVEVDLLGMFGDASAKPAAPKQQPNVPEKANAGAGQGAKTASANGQGDLLGELLSGSSPVKALRPQPAPAGRSADPLVSFGAKAAASAAPVDPLAAFLGAPAPVSRTSNNNIGDLLGEASGPKVGADGVIRVNGDDEVSKTPQRPRAPRPSGDFKGTGTSREALKQQFEEHVANKAQAAAQEIKRIEEEKRRYEDLKFQMAVLWEEAKGKWKAVGLHELVMPDQVKRIHRKAILLVHPDKVTSVSTETKLLAEQVHAILHEALEVFRKQENC